MCRSALFALALVVGVTACDDKKSTQSGGSGSSSLNSGDIQGHRPKKDPEKEKEYPPPPCHPGCFPAGTLVATPTGPRLIETIKAGEIVTLVGKDGAATSGSVHSVFTTDNRLVDVQTESGTVRTTVTQPLCLTAGGFRTGENLKAGDEIWRWVDGKRVAARVTSVAKTGVEAPVFNLVVGESAVFVAGGFLARGKPPADSEKPVTGHP